jgi:hypothetical protein
MADNVAGTIISFISKAAPFLGTLIGGPAGTAIGTLAGTGLNMVASALGVEPTQDAVAQAIATDPQAAEKLREFELNNKLELQKLVVQQFGMEIADKDSARKRQSEHEKATGKSDTNLYVLAWVLVLGFLVLTGLLLFFSYSGKTIADNTGILFMILGVLATSFGNVIGYFFGSSAGSAAKTDLLAKAEPIKDK